VSVSSSRLEAEVMAWGEAEGSKAAVSSAICSKKVASRTVKKEKSSDSYVHSVEASGNEEDRSVDVITEGEKNAVLVLVRLAKQEDSPQ
jgi:hypothetical protein